MGRIVLYQKPGAAGIWVERMVRENVMQSDECSKLPCSMHLSSTHSRSTQQLPRAQRVHTGGLRHQQSQKSVQVN